MEEELWRPVKCLPEQEKVRAQYEVSNWGRIRNARTGRCLVPHLLNTGYCSLNYRVREKGRKTLKNKGCLWHRIVALTWIPNPDNLPQIDHIDNNKCNNHPSNLRWVSAQENVQKSKEQHRPKLGNRYKPIYEINNDGQVVKCYKDAQEAADAKQFSVSRVMRLCSNDLRPTRWGTFTQEAYLNYLGKTIVEDGDHYKIIDLNEI